MTGRNSILLVLAGLLSAPTLASAAERSPLRTLDRATIVDLVPLLEGGEVALVESKDNGHLRQVTFFALANATPKQILDVVADVERYPEFISNIDHVKVLQTSGKRSKVEWQLSMPIVTIGGINQVFDGRPSHIRYRAVEGDLRKGFWRWEAVPLDDGRRSVAVLYTYADLRESHWLLEKLIEIRPDLEHSAVITGNLVQLKGILNEAERRAGNRSGSRRPKAGRWRPTKLKSVAHLLRGSTGRGMRGLLARGEVALIRSRRSGHLEQAIVAAVVDRPRAEVRAVVVDVERYAEFMPTVEEIEVRQRSGETVKYNVHLDIPLFSMEVETELKPRGPHRLSLKILGGDLKRGRYGWEFLSLDGGKRTLALYHGNADLRSQGFLLKTLIDKEPYLDHGLNVGIQLVTVRAVDQRTLALAK